MSEKESQNDTLNPEPKHGSSKHNAVPHCKQGEEHVLPKNRLGFVFAGLMACVFLAALDQV